MRFCYSHLEDYIKNLYLNIGITQPEQINMKTIASRLNLKLLLVPFKSMCTGNLICIDARLRKEKQWQHFGHELCHALWHSGNQLGISPTFREYQEWKAIGFAYHMCVPTFMLDDIYLPNTYNDAAFIVSKMFNVEYEFAFKRIENYMSRELLYSS
ncbi:ImmA/IrrE family metallo-endopeptidase [uncultured Rummeliibacillus sp.]|uniref:ImmA/IrrE family metallo-endopeptidase n=1 Tax=uncultured Rummeliibacillus sp. TaxID=762292 RepID=UPI0026157636|nr:ImmA/IrrE family metallo-endopeptidase [uncultured Rummeliibacillus sp.]